LACASASDRRAMTATGGVLAHTVSGDGPPLLLLNGGLMSYPAWEPLAGPLSGRFRLVRCDFRGQLLSPGPAPTTLEGHAADLLQLLDALQIESAHVAGVSLGALVGVTLAAGAPQRVRSLIAMNATDRGAWSPGARSRPRRSEGRRRRTRVGSRRCNHVVGRVSGGAGRGDRGPAAGGRSPPPLLVRGTRAADGVTGGS
jgi:pimeloyl-ACP methyl ester carboxylesterase